MKVKFLGTGGAFDYEYGSSAMTIDLEQRILVDCGPSIYPQLMRKGLMDSIDLLVITHLHGDHIGSVFQMVYYLKHYLNRVLRIACATEKFRQEIEALLAAMQISQDYYRLVPLAEIKGVEAIETTGRHAENVTSFSYIFTHDGQTVFYSGDLGDIGVLSSFLDSVDAGRLTVFHEMSATRNRAHTYYSDLCDLLGRADIYAYHLNPEQIPQDNKVPLVQNHPELLW